MAESAEKHCLEWSRGRAWYKFRTPEGNEHVEQVPLPEIPRRGSSIPTSEADLGSLASAESLTVDDLAAAKENGVSVDQWVLSQLVGNDLGEDQKRMLRSILSTWPKGEAVAAQLLGDLQRPRLGDVESKWRDYYVDVLRIAPGNAEAVEGLLGMLKACEDGEESVVVGFLDSLRCGRRLALIAAEASLDVFFRDYIEGSTGVEALLTAPHAAAQFMSVQQANLLLSALADGDAETLLAAAYIFSRSTPPFPFGSGPALVARLGEIRRLESARRLEIFGILGGLVPQATLREEVEEGLGSASPVVRLAAYRLARSLDFDGLAAFVARAVHEEPDPALRQVLRALEPSAASV